MESLTNHELQTVPFNRSGERVDNMLVILMADCGCERGPNGADLCEEHAATLEAVRAARTAELAADEAEPTVEMLVCSVHRQHRAYQCSPPCSARFARPIGIIRHRVAEHWDELDGWEVLWAIRSNADFAPGTRPATAGQVASFR